LKTVCEATIDYACRIRNKYCFSNVVLNGGVFENVYRRQTCHPNAGRSDAFQDMLSEQLCKSPKRLLLNILNILDLMLERKT